MTTLYDFLAASANSALALQEDSGAMPAGHNGPYHDPETPVRNTAHWAITFLKAFEITEDSKFELAARRCLNYLMSREARPMGATFWHRKNPEKDFANGLVGQAWTIEALLQLGLHFKVQEPIDIAVSTFKLHPFDRRFGMWKKVNVDGTYSSFDQTFNHQLWFAASGALIYETTKDIEIKETIDYFLTKLAGNFFVYGNGLIKHKHSKFLAHSPIFRVNNYFKLFGKGEYLKMKGYGYHAFNLYALALIKPHFPDHDFWENKKVKQAIHYATTTEFRANVAKSKYGYPYNPPGFEVGYALEVFDIATMDEIGSWVTDQFEKCFDLSTMLMTQGGTFDPNTAAARIYEGTRMKDYLLALE